jgi:large subunit ribosomal protein L13
MKVIEGKGAILGRIASYSAKEALKGEEIAIVNCEQIIITGNKENIQREFDEKTKKVGHGQTGPKFSRDNEKFVKRIIRGMLPNHREGRGREALKRIKCYKGVPKEFEKEKRISMINNKKLKFIEVSEVFVK